MTRNSKYYYELERLRQFISNPSITATTVRTKFARQFGIDPDPPAIYIIALLLDITISKPSELAYSELNRITSIAHSLLVDSILTNEAKFLYIEQLRTIVFLLG